MIQKDTYIEDIIMHYPQLVKPLKDYGVTCIACGEALWGTLEEQAREKGIDNLDGIITKLNRLIQE